MGKFLQRKGEAARETGSRYAEADGRLRQFEGRLQAIRLSRETPQAKHLLLGKLLEEERSFASSLKKTDKQSYGCLLTPHETLFGEIWNEIERQQGLLDRPAKGAVKRRALKGKLPEGISPGKDMPERKEWKGGRK